MIAVTQENGNATTYRLVAFQVTASEVFSTSLPFDTSTDTLGSGQGNLETYASTDDYLVTLSASRPLELDTSSCSTGQVHIKVFDSSGSKVAEHGGCGQFTTGALSAATYPIAVTQENGGATTYRLVAFQVPASEVFSTSLPFDTSTDTLGSGQGDLETGTSTDDYLVTLSASHPLELDATSCATGLVHIKVFDSSG